MKSVVSIILALGLCLCSARAEESLHAYLDASVECVVSVRSIADIRAQWQTHPFAQVWAAQFQEVFESVAEAAVEPHVAGESDFATVLQDAFGLSVDEFYALIPGQACVALYNGVELLDASMDEEAPVPPVPDFVLMVEYAGDADALHRLMQVQFERNARLQQEVNPLVEHQLLEETFMGETLYVDERFDGAQTVVEDAYVLVDGIFILAPRLERLRTTVEAIHSGADHALTEDAIYLRAREQGGRGDGSVYLNLAAILPKLNAALLDDSVDLGLAMLGVSATSLREALALESAEALFADLDAEPDGLLPRRTARARAARAVWLVDLRYGQLAGGAHCAGGQFVGFSVGLQHQQYVGPPGVAVTHREPDSDALAGSPTGADEAVDGDRLARGAAGEFPRRNRQYGRVAGQQ